MDQKPKTPLLEGHRQERGRHFKIEHDEQQRHQIEAHVEFHARVVEGLKPHS